MRERLRGASGDRPGRRGRRPWRRRTSSRCRTLPSRLLGRRPTLPSANGGRSTGGRLQQSARQCRQRRGPRRPGEGTPGGGRPGGGRTIGSWAWACSWGPQGRRLGVEAVDGPANGADVLGHRSKGGGSRYDRRSRAEVGNPAGGESVHRRTGAPDLEGQRRPSQRPALRPVLVRRPGVLGPVKCPNGRPRAAFPGVLRVGLKRERAAGAKSGRRILAHRGETGRSALPAGPGARSGCLLGANVERPEAAQRPRPVVLYSTGSTCSKVRRPTWADVLEAVVLSGANVE